MYYGFRDENAEKTRVSETFNTVKDWNLSISVFIKLRALTLTEAGEAK